MLWFKSLRHVLAFLKFWIQYFVLFGCVNLKSVLRMSSFALLLDAAAAVELLLLLAANMSSPCLRVSPLLTYTFCVDVSQSYHDLIMLFQFVPPHHVYLTILCRMWSLSSCIYLTNISLTPEPWAIYAVRNFLLWIICITPTGYM